MLFQESPRLTSLTIEGLYGAYDVRVPFNDPVTVLVGENGTGKTTVLSALYNLLSGHYSALARLKFGRMQAEYSDGQVLRVEASELPKLAQYETPDETGAVDLVRRWGSNWKTSYDLISVQLADRAYHELEAHRRSLVDTDILYLPTYRRIEDDLDKLAREDTEIELNSQELIRFGMSDVEDRLSHVTSEIKSSSVEWFAKVTSRMLEELVSYGLQPNSVPVDILAEPGSVAVVLGRLGRHISNGYRSRIQNAVSSGAIKDNPALFYFLSNLVLIYNQQSKKDRLLKTFAELCNGYLYKKRVAYDESAVELRVLGPSDQKIRLSDLSSGEKQIVSLFSRLLLSEEPDHIVLFDEPELSLSIEWQKRLLPDIVSTERTRSVIAATHSPFIFDNAYDESVVLLSSCIHQKG